jgi:hypothetical protein
MSKSTILQRYAQVCETRDQHEIEALRTHYYRSTFDKVYQTVESLFKVKQGVFVEQSKERGEMAFELKGKNSMFIVTTITTFEPFRIAVDFTLTSEQKKMTGIYKVLKEYAIDLYKELDRALIV